MRNYLVQITSADGLKVSYAQEAKTAVNAITLVIKRHYLGARITAVSAEEFGK